MTDLGFRTPRPVQAATIPAALDGRDVLGLAQTGTGKTAAFALPILERLHDSRSRTPRALIVAPTRELAIQIHAELTELAKHTKVTATTVYGGVNQSRQVRALRARPDVVVACPGRLLDLCQQGECDLSGVEVLVLDEADHMFDMGFLPDVRRILRLLPERRQNLLFSATMPKELRGLANQVLHDPHVVELEHSRPADTIDHFLYPVEQSKKTDLLDHLLQKDDFESAIVFARTKHRARRVARDLDRRGHRAIALQGNMSQSQRDRAMEGFRLGRYDVLVATDIAARGIDVAGISHVVNFDLPNTPDAYTHRIGRTGRSEESGVAITFVTGEDTAGVRAIERKLGEEIPRRFVKGFASKGSDERRPSNGRKPLAAKSRSRRGAASSPKSSSTGRRAATAPSNHRESERPQPAKPAKPTSPFGAGLDEALETPARRRRARRPKGAGPGRSRSKRGR